MFTSFPNFPYIVRGPKKKKFFYCVILGHFQESADSPSAGDPSVPSSSGHSPEDPPSEFHPNQDPRANISLIEESNMLDELLEEGIHFLPSS